MDTHELYMHRCIELARLGAGYVTPNPMVGAVLIHNDRIIGEGYHKQYGQPHAEVNCLESVSPIDKNLITQSTLYVSLEPCAHFGKTPPCTDLILSQQIPRVVVGCGDPFDKVDGKGIQKLRHEGVEVVTGVLEKECRELNKKFFAFHTEQRPYIVLKWAQSINQKIANSDKSRVLISNDYSNMLVHKWRSEEAGIMVGTNTASLDNPSLNVRLWKGNDPVRLVVDFDLKLPSSLNIFDGRQATIIFNSIKDVEEQNVKFVRVDNKPTALQGIIEACFQNNIQSILVEGGSKLLQSFIDEGLWDEARVIQNNQLVIADGLAAPKLINQQLVSAEVFNTDSIFYFNNLNNNSWRHE